MTLLDFHPLKESVDLPVIRVIALNGDAETTRHRDGLRSFIDRSGSGTVGATDRSPSNVNGRAMLFEHRGNTFTDATAGSGYNCDFIGQERKAAHDSDLQILS
jgi:hypothetical protein